MKKIHMYEGIGLTGDKHAVVIDIGTAYTKFGFTGEPAPRCITKSEVKCPDTKQIKKVYTYKSTEELYNTLVSFIHNLYFRHLLVSPKDRRVVIVESLLSTTIFRETLAKVLFNHFEVSSLLFVPSHLVAPTTLGVQTALVLDVGHQEALLIPVFEGVPILHAWQGQPFAGEAINTSLMALLAQHATESGDSGMVKTVELLSDDIIEDIKVRTCFVTSLERSQKAAAGQPLPPPPSVEYQSGSNISFTIPGTIREYAAEVIFEQDTDQLSLATMILDAIVKCPRDVRRPLAENILLVGGTAMTIGFKARLQSELLHHVKTPKYAAKTALTTFKFHSPAAKENYVSWLGASIFGSTELLQARSLTKEVYSQDGRVPDWSSLAYNRKELDNVCL